MHILLASDGSSHSRRATRWLRDLALPSDTKITVLTVATLDEPPRDAVSMAELRASANNNARRIAERTAETLKRRRQHLEVLVTDGDPRVEIFRTGEDLAVGMIVLGARGLGRVKRLLVGSTSLAVARYALCPVAIVRGRPHKTRRMLVAVDGTDGARAAVRFLAISELERESHVTLLHVLPRAAGAHGGHPERGEGDRKQQAEAESILDDAATMLGESRHPERLVAYGDPADEIVKTAQSHDVDIVVVGARGLRTLGRFLLGSVSETVLHRADRPVIIVREGVHAIR